MGLVGEIILGRRNCFLPGTTAAKTTENQTHCDNWFSLSRSEESEMERAASESTVSQTQAELGPSQDLRSRHSETPASRSQGPGLLQLQQTQHQTRGVILH